MHAQHYTDNKQPLKICAFNIQIFGRTKFGKPAVVNTLSKVIEFGVQLTFNLNFTANPIQIVRQCDVVLIQEIRDSSETIIYKFLDVVNR